MRALETLCVMDNKASVTLAFVATFALALAFYRGMITSREFHTRGCICRVVDAN